MRRVALVLALGALAAGCGDDVDESNDYVEKVNKAQTDFASQATKLGSQITATSSLKADARAFERIQSALRKTVADLKGIEPPDDVADLHRRLVSTVEAYVGVVGQAKDVVASRPDPAEAASEQAELASENNRIASRLNSTIDEINKKLRE